jgi:hypothetical protein
MPDSPRSIPMHPSPIAVASWCATARAMHQADGGSPCFAVALP